MVFLTVVDQERDINNIIQIVIFIYGVDENFYEIEEFMDIVFMVSIILGNDFFLCFVKSLMQIG